MGLPFNQQNDTNSGGSENFTLRRNQARLITGKPTFKNGGFYSAQPVRKQNKRRHVPTFGTVGQTERGLSDIQRHFLQGRGITLPRCSESTTDISQKPRNEGNTISDSSSESEIEAHTKIHQSISDSDTTNGVRKIYPWKLLQARQRFGLDDQQEYDDNDDIYDTIAIENFKFTPRRTDSENHIVLDDDVFVATKELTYSKLNLETDFQTDSRRQTLERSTSLQKYPHMSKYVGKMNSVEQIRLMFERKESDDNKYCTLNLKETPSPSVRSLTNTISSGSESIRSRDSSLPASVSPSETGTIRSVCSIPSSIKIPPRVLPKPIRKSVNAFHGSLRCKPLKSALKTSSLQHNIKLSDYIDDFGEEASPKIVRCKRISFRRSKKIEKDLANSALKDDNSDSVCYTSYRNAAFVDDMENGVSGRATLEPIDEGPITLIL